MADPVAKPIPRIYGFERYSLYVPVEGTVKRSRLVWGMRGDFPRISIFTNHPDDNINSGIMSCSFDPVTFNLFLDSLLAIARSPEESRKIWKFDVSVWKDGKNTGERRHACDLLFGKDKEGVVWLSIIIEGRPKIKFMFELSNFYTIEGLSKGQASSMITAATVNHLRDIYNLKLAANIGDGSTGISSDTSEVVAPVTKQPAAAAADFDDILF